jgi:phosphoribosylanthranilate isomerase
MAPDFGPQPRLKVCGLRQPAQARAVAALGVEALGVIGVSTSPRYLAAAERPALFAAMAELPDAAVGRSLWCVVCRHKAKEAAGKKT